MPGKHLFEYSVIRFVPRVEREEFLNVGVVLYCPSLKFLGTCYQKALERVRLLATDPAQLEDVDNYLQAFKLITDGDARGGPIARLDLPSRFRWLTATRSTIIQCSKIHPGFCGEPGEQLLRLYDQLVALPSSST